MKHATVQCHDTQENAECGFGNHKHKGDRCLGKGMSKFTLIELLVVISIIAILASLLLPALGKAKEKGIQILCVSKLHNLGQSLTMYCDDNNSWFPCYYSGGGYNNARLFAPYNPFCDYVKMAETWTWPSKDLDSVCPAVPDGYDVYQSSYSTTFTYTSEGGFARALYTPQGPDYYIPRRIDKVASLSTILICTKPNEEPGPGSTCSTAYPGHYRVNSMPFSSGDTSRFNLHGRTFPILLANGAVMIVGPTQRFDDKFQPN
jgi:prepilin-type N-terminal cleavage/methylation domain-containing protein